MKTPFGEVLAELVTALPGASGAVFVDWEGEEVDEHSAPGGSDLRLIGAHWAIAYYQARTALEKHGLGVPDELVLRFGRQQILVRRVTDEYLLVLAIGAAESLGRSLHLLRIAEDRLRSLM